MNNNAIAGKIHEENVLNVTRPEGEAASLVSIYVDELFFSQINYCAKSCWQ